MASLTPMMRQYQQMKEQHKDCLLFFRLGDFYEMFFEDAIEASRLLNLTLTKRHTTPMCGVPHHAAESYIGRLTRLGKKVAICEQLSDPSLPGIVERGVIRVVTPGTTFDERILDQKSNNFIVSVVFCDEKMGLAACDLTTGLLQVATFENLEDLRDELFRLGPAECVIDGAEKNIPDFLKQFDKLPVFPHQFWDDPQTFLSKHFGVKDLRGFGMEVATACCDTRRNSVSGEGVAAAELGRVSHEAHAAALLLSYLKETQKSDLAHIRPPQVLSRTDEMILDETAIRNLELLANLREGKREGSLLSVIDFTRTSMGGRTLRSWLLHPIHNKENIEKRLDVVSEMLSNDVLALRLPEILDGVLDLERLLGKISIGTGGARDVLGIAISLKALEPIKDLLQNSKSNLLTEFLAELEKLKSLGELRQNLLSSIVEAPPLSIKDGGLICDGISPELDELRRISREGKSFIQQIQEQEVKRTGINSLKIRFNNVFGYYIEITKSNLKNVPADYIRKQTLVNAERFITPELKEYEEKVLGADAKMKEIEYQIFLRLREQTKDHTREIQKAAEVFGMLDALISLALAAAKNRYTRPQIAEAGSSLVIKDGRHPVVEQLAGGQFVPNDTELGEARIMNQESKDGSQIGNIMLLTGPNMGGKSTYLRQTALIVLMAHIGSFVPAQSAQIPLTDRIFTRVGASDNLVRGQSTFMVEMQETAQILHYATRNSLIILDEIGRGTSTYDGVSLAWAILEHIHDQVGAKTLFATHYHELISVAEKLSQAQNFSVAVKEEKDGVVFLYRIKPGAVDRSYGIEVARLAGLPPSIIHKAKEILRDLEEGILDSAITKKAQAQSKNKDQLDIFATENSQPRPHRALQELQKIEVEKLTPLEALQKLDELKRL